MPPGPDQRSMRALKPCLALPLVLGLAACAGDPITTRDPNPGPPRGYRVLCETGPFLGPYGELTATFDAECRPVLREERRVVIRAKG